MTKGNSTFTELSAQLAHGCLEERLDAVQTLADADTPEARHLLLAATCDGERAIRQASRAALAAVEHADLANRMDEILSGDWSGIDWLVHATEVERELLFGALRCLLGRVGDARRWVLHAFGRLGDRRAIPLVKPYLRSKDPLRQRAASTALGLLGATDLVPDLLALLLSRDAHVVECALTALGRLGETRLVAAYRGVPDGVGDAMLDALHLVNEGDRRIILPLLRGLARPDHRCRTISTGLTLCAMDVAEAVPHISAILDEIAAEALEDEDCDAAGEFIVSAAGILGSFALPEAAAAAVNLLANPLHRPWQPELADKLSTGLNPVALPTVLALLRDGASWADHMPEEDNCVRTWACQLLGGLGDQDAIRPLLETARRPDADDDLRVAAVSAVDEICARDPAAVQLLPSLDRRQR